MSDLPAFENTLGDWASDAACRGVDPDVFHPVDGDYALARTICNRCPVQADCLTEAVTNGDPYGFRCAADLAEVDRLEARIRDARGTLG